MSEQEKDLREMPEDSGRTDVPEATAAVEASATESAEPPIAAGIEEVAAVPEPVAAPLPGAMLRAAREQAGLTLSEVAQSLKFGVRQIEALEADDYDALPGTTFVRGFVRGYAKLLKQDPEALLGLLDTRSPAALPDVRPPQNMGEAATTTAGARRSSSPMLLGAAVLALLAAGLGVWQFMSHKTSAPATPRPSATSSPAAGTDAVTLQPPQIRIEPTPGMAGETAVANAPIPVPPGARQLIFVFEDKSWLEVKDATQRIVATGVFPAGERQTATGKPPFQVWVGKASGVKVYDGEREIDLKPHTRDEVARLTVD